MELKFVIPNMEKTFGNLEFAGEDKTSDDNTPLFFQVLKGKPGWKTASDRGSVHDL